jgi:hypothetical protein
MVRSGSAERAKSAKNDASPILDSPAKLVAKRQVPLLSGYKPWFNATFEFGDGQRIELDVQKSEFGMLAEGDQGIVRYQGTRFLGFRREA